MRNGNRTVLILNNEEPLIKESKTRRAGGGYPAAGRIESPNFPQKSAQGGSVEGSWAVWENFSNAASRSTQQSGYAKPVPHEGRLDSESYAGMI
ncbi:unnamed protein product [Echinostoma caproni]|uniref:Uncharacterized protein n=1 Tax=Echinostoma caproni TaxID=27848 RepID=A0A183ARI9_9TREM|nr:unnamed protein product [Echinostoma caproni]